MIGTQIGPFVLQRLLGAGGMGSVYLARHALMDDLHAIKVLDPLLTQNEHVVSRFVNEARAAARLRHRNLIRVHNIDRMPDDGPWYMVLDYLDGSTLARLIASHAAPISPALILQILAQVCNGIQHVHEHRIVHRDLKPENIFLVRTAEDPQFPVVLDLGVAQLSEELASGPVTRSGTVVGTPIYMAPEQLRGERVSPSADVFALGVIAYEMCTGGYFPYQQSEARAAYLSLPATEIYFRQRAVVVVDPRHRNAALGTAWADVIRATLDADPARRPASARALVLALAEALDADSPGAGGREIVGRVAHELVVDPAAPPHGAMPRPGAVPGGEPGPRGQSEPRLTALPPDSPMISTLAGTASQSVALAKPGRRWGLVAIATAVAIGIGAIGAVAVETLHAPLAPAPAAIATGSAVVAAVVAEPAGAAPRPPPTTTASPPPAIAPQPPTPPPSRPEQPMHASAPRAAPTAPRAAPSAPAVRPPGVAAARKTGVLHVIVRPWAQIWLNGAPAGETPYRNALPAGRYQLRIANQFAHKDETITIAVHPSGTTTVERSW